MILYSDLIFYICDVMILGFLFFSNGNNIEQILKHFNLKIILLNVEIEYFFAQYDDGATPFPRKTWIYEQLIIGRHVHMNTIIGKTETRITIHRMYIHTKTIYTMNKHRKHQSCHVQIWEDHICHIQIYDQRFIG